MSNDIYRGYFKPASATERLRAYLYDLVNVREITAADMSRGTNIPTHEIIDILTAVGVPQIAGVFDYAAAVAALPPPVIDVEKRW